MRSAESAVGERPKSVVSRAVDIASREIEEVEAHKRDVPLARRKKTETEFERYRMQSDSPTSPSSSRVVSQRVAARTRLPETRVRN